MASMLRFLGLNPGIINKIESVSFSFSNTLSAFILLIIVLLPITWYLCKFEGKPINKKKKFKLLMLRLIWMTIISILVAGPVITITGLVPEKSKIAVMIDASKSMSIGNNSVSQEVTRIDSMKEVIKNGFLDKIEAKTSVRPDVFTFSESVYSCSKQDITKLNIEANGNQTDLNGAIKYITGSLGGSSLLGIIMMTDGMPTIGGNLVNEAINIKTPIHFIMPDYDSKSTDVSISLVNPPSIGYLNSGLRIKGNINIFGNVPTPVTVKVSCNGQPYSDLTVEMNNKSQSAEFNLNIPCNQEGNFKYEFSVATLSNELTTDNNTAGFLLKVVRERLNILAISGSPSWELKFMSNAAMSDPNAHFRYFAKAFDNRWLEAEDLKPKKGEKFPDFISAINEADVIILNGVNYKDIQGFEQAIINKVEAGMAGLYFMASDKTFVQLGYRNTEFEKLLPVMINEEKEKSSLGNIVLANNTEYSFLRIIDDPAQNSEFFASLPKPEMIYEYSGLKAGAEVLLNINSGNNEKKLSYMIKTRYGRGNIVLTTGGPIWISGFKLVPTDYGISPYTAMFVNMFKMLANRHEDAQVVLEIPSNKNVVGMGSEIKIWVSDTNHQLISNAQIVLSATDEKGQKVNVPCVETSEKGCYEATFVPMDKGIYKFEAEASHRGKLFTRAYGEMLVELPTAEFDNPAINIEVMEKVASITGGLCVTAKDADRIFETMNIVNGEKTLSKTLDLRDSWLILILVLLLPSIEWYMRRTGGLS